MQVVEVVAPAAALGDAVPGVRALLAGGRAVVVRVTEAGPADLAVVDALARLALCARRGTGRLSVVAEGPDLRRLVALAGLSEVLGGSASRG